MNAHRARAELLIHQGRHQEAESELRLEVAENPEAPIGYCLLAVCLAEQGRRQDALEASERAVSLGPDLAFAHRIRALVFTRFGQHREAEAAAREALRLDSGDAHHHSALAMALLNQKRWKEALASAEGALNLDAEDVDALNFRAIALTSLGRREEAGQAIHTALHKAPENAESHANMGWTLLHGGDHAKAQEHFREALRLDPDSSWARHGIVEALKARNFFYRNLLRFFLWTGGLSQRAQWVLIIGLVFVFSSLSSVKTDQPVLQALIDGLVAGYTLFVFICWLHNPLFNLLLRLDRFGRRVLTDRQRRDSTWGGLAVLTVALLISAHAALHGGFASSYAMPLLAVGATLNLKPERRRLAASLTFIIFGAAIAYFTRDLPALQPEALRAMVQIYQTTGSQQSAAATLARFAPEALKATLDYSRLQGHLRDTFVWGSMGMTWLGALLLSRR